MSFWDRLDAAGEQHSVLRHPFYRRWSEGTLRIEELAHYSGQYRHAVRALADAAAQAARSPEAGADRTALAAHAAEEEAHVELWDRFLVAAGGDLDAQPSPETRACAAMWAGEESRPLLNALVTMYAVESVQPAISQTKLDGLAVHYGITSAEYFELHRELDVEHAAHARALIERRMRKADEESLISSAEGAWRANWRLLDGVDAART